MGRDSEVDGRDHLGSETDSELVDAQVAEPGDDEQVADPGDDAQDAGFADDTQDGLVGAPVRSVASSGSSVSQKGDGRDEGEAP